MRVSLKELFVIVAFFAVLAWCAAQAGFDNGMFWLAVLAATIVSSIFIFLAKDEKRRAWAPLVAAGGLLCCCTPAVVSLAMLANSILLLLLSFSWSFAPPRRFKTVCAVVMTCGAISLVAGVLPGMFQLRQLEALRREFPIVSLESRLEYEQRGRAVGAADPLISAEVSTRLAEMEQELDHGAMRAIQFEQIHDRQYESFVRANGFGVGRMITPLPKYLRRPPLQDIAFDANVANEATATSRNWSAFFQGGQSNDLQHVHRVSRRDFFDPDGFGAVIEPRKRIVGFVEHGFHYPPGASLKNREAWTIERVELVSLLKFDEPRVYVLDHLPRMDQLSGDDAPTRALDDFEAGALAKLWTDEDVVVEQREDAFRMLGSLRAAEQCLNCHSVQRGELLGAFSYVLRQGVAGEGE